jgi:hypothetical protein
MSYREKDFLTESDFKVKLVKMGYSLDRADHPKNYYKNMYFEKSNAKNKITRDNTPFYQEDLSQIINKKRQRSSSKKTNQKKNLGFDEDDEEENFEPKNLYNNKKGIKYTRLIESKKKIKQGNNIENTEEKKNLKNEKNKYVANEYNLRSKKKNKSINEIKDISKEQNIINFGAQSNNYNNTDYNLLNVKNPQRKNKYDYIIKSSDKKNKQEIKEINTDINNLNNLNNINNELIKPEIITRKKILLKSPENNDIDINNNEQFRNVEDKNILFNSNNNNNIFDNRNINMEIEENNRDNNRIIEENPKENSETSSYYSAASSRFSRFSNYTLMSLSRLGSNIVSIKNSIMNKFKRNAYLFPLIILILFGIVFFLNEKYESYDRNNIIIIFSIIMGLIILFYLILYIKELRKYKKIAKEDRKKLLELFEQLNIKKEDIGNNTILLNNFINERINQNNEINEETYMRYVFPYLVKYLKRDGFYLDKIENDENNNYWKEL